jgi:hypothetical protein
MSEYLFFKEQFTKNREWKNLYQIAVPKPIWATRPYGQGL